MLIDALHVREEYMKMSNQSFPLLTSRFLRSGAEGPDIDHHVHDDKKTVEGNKAELLMGNNYLISITGSLVSWKSHPNLIMD